MNANSESERVDALLALAVVFGGAPEERDAAGGADAGGQAEVGPAPAALDSLSALDAPTREAVERRAAWYSRLPRRKQRDWLAHTLARARADAAEARLDEHVHPSHVVEALRGEPERVRALVARHLPPSHAAAVADAFGAAPTEAGMDGGGAPPPETVAVVRRVFLSRFVTAAELERVTPLEQLSGAELARLVRALGVRETAVACRGIEAVEAVASFLRRFAPEDARAVAAHIASLTDLDAARVRLAERVVREAHVSERDAGAMLDRAGMRILAAALAGPARGEPDEEAREALREAAREVEQVAAGLRRGGRRARESGRPADGAGPAEQRPVVTQGEAPPGSGA